MECSQVVPYTRMRGGPLSARVLIHYSRVNDQSTDGSNPGRLAQTNKRYKSLGFNIVQ